MECNITGKQMELTEAMKDAAGNALYASARIYDDKIIDANIVLSKEHHKFAAEVVMNIAGDRLVVKSIDEDMYAAIADMGDRLAKTVRRKKEKRSRINRTTIREFDPESV